MAILASFKVLQDRQDMEGLENLAPLLKRQQMLIDNREANEEIGQRNATIYAGEQEREFSPFSNYW